MDNENKNQPALTGDELWAKACAGLSATREELGLPENQNKMTGVVSLNFELNHSKNGSKSSE